MADSWRYVPGNEGCPWSEGDLSAWHDLLGDHVHHAADEKAPVRWNDEECLAQIKTELAHQRMMSNLVSKEVYHRDIDEIKKLMAEALRRRDEDFARQRELLHVRTAQAHPFRLTGSFLTH